MKDKKTCEVCGRLISVKWNGLTTHKGPCKLPCSGGLCYDGPTGSYHGKGCPCTVTKILTKEK